MAFYPERRRRGARDRSTATWSCAGVKTLAVRMDRHCANAAAVVDDARRPPGRVPGPLPRPGRPTPATRWRPGRCGGSGGWCRSWSRPAERPTSAGGGPLDNRLIHRWPNPLGSGRRARSDDATIWPDRRSDPDLPPVGLGQDRRDRLASVGHCGVGQTAATTPLVASGIRTRTSANRSRSCWRRPRAALASGVEGAPMHSPDPQAAGDGSVSPGRRPRRTRPA